MPKTAVERMAKMRAMKKVNRAELLRAFQEHCRRIPVYADGYLLGFDLRLGCSTEQRADLEMLAQDNGRSFDDVVEECFDRERQAIRKRERLAAEAKKRQRLLERTADLHAKAERLDAEANELLGK